MTLRKDLPASVLKGGNAFDAAVGAMIALGEPEMNGIGGNGFMTLFDKESGKILSLLTRISDLAVVLLPIRVVATPRLSRVLHEEPRQNG